MILNILSPRKSLNKSFLKTKPNRTDIETFKVQLAGLLKKISEDESEEFHKNLISDFLKKTYYDPRHSINTKGKNDLVIHNGENASTSVGIIIEAKSPKNKSEMLKIDDLNVKAFQELVLYYLRERITNKNLEIRNLIATNINEWYIFDANIFEKEFASNSALVKQFIEFEAGRLSGKTTDFFYKYIAEPAISAIDTEITFTHVSLKEYGALLDGDKANESKLIALFKLFSPEHLLKLPFSNDSNTLNRGFYSELLHILGLAEWKEEGKRKIGRNKEGTRNNGSILENAITQIQSLDKLSRVGQPNRFGNSTQEQLFSLGLELVITWINRVIFLKLLEAQLITYHKNDPTYSFLNIGRIKDYDDLNDLFFKVLALRPSEREAEVQDYFSKVPYLNSSLFEPTEVEHLTLFVSNLKKGKKIPILGSTVLKDEKGKKRKGELDSLEYLLEFLDSYDFASESAEQIREHNKSLINASVLGLIFENINGYKDGSFYTPGFVTMYMCRESIRRAVVQRFNEAKEWNCKTIPDVYNKIEDRQEANDIINSLRICDPAVGSGHFLVSALNELISVKNDLKILQDRDGKRLKEYHVEVVNDELIVTDEDGALFSYVPTKVESQRVQETLFYEKQTLIENCLFGVDVNPNSVKICRLRLWIELLKSAFYKANGELETLPNIDINIKSGNSLVSRFALDSNLKEALKKSKCTLSDYRVAVSTYRDAKSKDEKRAMESIIASIKAEFRSEILSNDPKYRKQKILADELYAIKSQQVLFEETAKVKRFRQGKIAKLDAALKKVNSDINTIKNNRLFEGAFEWRFEFPEVLNDDGDFLGFDVVIGNPPYISAINLKKLVSKEEYAYYKAKYSTAKGTVDMYIYFFELGVNIVRKDQFMAFISPNRFLSASYGRTLREFLLNKTSLHVIGDYSNVKVFKEASTYPVVTLLRKTPNEHELRSFTYVGARDSLRWRSFSSEELFMLNDHILGFVLSDKFEISKKIISQSEAITKCGLINATSTAAEADIFHGLINSTSGFKLINTGTIDKFCTTWGVERLNDQGVRYLTPYLPNDVIKLGQNRHSLYSKPKIIFAKIAVTPEAFFDSTGQCASINTNCIHTFSDEYSPYYVTGWVNSKLFQYLFECFFDGLKMSGGYLLYSAPNLMNMYIKNIDLEAQKDIEFEVINIMKEKLADFNADTSSREITIDQLFYKLYGLSNEEIENVERNCGKRAFDSDEDFPQVEAA